MITTLPGMTVVPLVIGFAFLPVMIFGQVLYATMSNPTEKMNADNKLIYEEEILFFQREIVKSLFQFEYGAQRAGLAESLKRTGKLPLEIQYMILDECDAQFKQRLQVALKPVDCDVRESAAQSQRAAMVFAWLRGIRELLGFDASASSIPSHMIISFVDEDDINEQNANTEPEEQSSAPIWISIWSRDLALIALIVMIRVTICIVVLRLTTARRVS